MADIRFAKVIPKKNRCKHCAGYGCIIIQSFDTHEEGSRRKYDKDLEVDCPYCNGRGVKLD